MQQDCTFMPLMRDREVVAVCVTISDVTHVSIVQREREEAVAKLQEYADRDGLTGIANRRFSKRACAMNTRAGSATAAKCPCCCSISITSRKSTTSSATASAIRCCA